MFRKRRISYGKYPEGSEIGLLAFAFLVVACGPAKQKGDSDATPRTGDSIAGTYTCVHPGGDTDVLVLAEDGKLTITPQEEGRGEPSEGTWSLEGDTVTFTVRGETESFTLVPGKLGGDCTKSIVATYMCGPGGEPAEDIVEFREDGTVKITQPGREPGENTYSVEGGRGAINTPEGPDRFAIEGDRLLFDDGFVCTKKAS